MSSMPKGYVQVCGARTAEGTPCLRPAAKGRARCNLHANRPGAPTGRLNGRYVHGRRTKEAVSRRAFTTERLRWARRVLRLCGGQMTATQPDLRPQLGVLLPEAPSLVSGVL